MRRTLSLPVFPFTLARRALLILALPTVSWVGVFAQIDRAVLEGTVTDPRERPSLGPV